MKLLTYCALLPTAEPSEEFNEPIHDILSVDCCISEIKNNATWFGNVVLFCYVGAAVLGVARPKVVVEFIRSFGTRRCVELLTAFLNRLVKSNRISKDLRNCSACGNSCTRDRILASLLNIDSSLRACLLL